jgi:large subunit ribosomal protein L21
MFAVIKTGGKQYRVTAEDEITIMTIPGEPGDEVSFGNVLMLARDGVTELGAPYLGGISVSGKIVEHARGPKVIAFKKRRRKNSRRKRGHRQDLTIVRITDILVDGAKALATTGDTLAPAMTGPEDV